MSQAVDLSAQDSAHVHSAILNEASFRVLQATEHQVVTHQIRQYEKHCTTW